MENKHGKNNRTSQAVHLLAVLWSFLANGIRQQARPFIYTCMCIALKIKLSQMDCPISRNTACFGRSGSWDTAAFLERSPGLLGWVRRWLMRDTGFRKELVLFYVFPTPCLCQPPSLVREPRAWTPSTVGCCWSCARCQHLVYLSQSTLCSQPGIVYGVETSLLAAGVSRQSAVIRTVVGWGNACFSSLLVVLEKLSWGASTLGSRR